jgi:glycyl-tRNA synthetase beta chain
MTTTHELLLEIGCEELPSAPLMKAIVQFGKLIDAGLDEAGLAHGEVRTLSTPRRLAVMVADVADATEEVHTCARGPQARIAFDAEGNPTKAALGFARGKGVDASDLVTREAEDGKTYVFADVNVASRPAAGLITELAERTIAALDFPRSQRWGSTHERFCRPVRWICCMLGSEVIPVRYADVISGNVTRGHRVLAPGDHVVAEASAYEDVLEKAFVLGEDRRRAVIEDGIKDLEATLSCHVDTPKRTFDEVVNLCEWPSVLVGHFDDEFLAVPHEIICESMLSNQRYFPVYDAEGELTTSFVVVSNADPAVSDTVVDGNERVVRARLDDAEFFYEEDLKTPLDDLLPRLDKVTFQERLGTVLQKVRRMEVLAPAVAREASADDTCQHEAERAAHLAKADLVSQAVVEFTSQQGVMGGYYAAAAGEPAEVCGAIRDQYRPRFAGDDLPEGLVGKCVAVSDKLDTICGMFAIDEPPTGSSDPFAVRRSAIGVLNILETLPSVSLSTLVDASLDAYAKQDLGFDQPTVSHAVCDYFAGRLAVMAKDAGVRPDTIEAVQATGVIDPAEFLRRAHALDVARASQADLFDDLATAYARASHLADASLGTDVDASLLTDPERALADACSEGQDQVAQALSEGDYESALGSLASLRAPIDTFFEDVLVMDDDPAIRENRLRLLNRFAGVFTDVADFGALARA